MALLSCDRFWNRVRSGRAILSDGAMGSELIGRGVAPDDVISANLCDAAMVQAVHNAYVDAGVEMLTSNTFGLPVDSNHLTAFRAGFTLAVSVAAASEREIGVWLSASTLAIPHVPDRDAVSLSPGPVPLFLLIETCTNLAAACEAIHGAARLCPDVLAVTGHFGPDGNMADGTTPEAFVRTTVSRGAHIVGANCGSSPVLFIELAERMRRVTSAPLLIQPSAGLPRLDDTANWTYPVGPVQFANAIAELLDVGVDIVGGCCGASPQHIAAARTQLAASGRLVG